tara:strand:- start:1922 stop:2338 length:417 start_codon:yes stop_codon:yes gene_type:complete
MIMIQFFNEDCNYTIVCKKEIAKKVLYLVESEGFKLECINIILCSDLYLLDINRNYLNHDYFTDIITFDQSDEQNQIEGDLFISIDRIKENSQLNKCSHIVELQRVILHGVLHLAGYKDKTNKEKSIMRTKEDFYLNY